MKTKLTKKLLSLLVCLVMLLQLLPAVAFAAEAVSYTSYSWNGSKLVSSVNTVSNYTEVTTDTREMSNGWYVVKGNVSINARIKITGTVNLVLMDNCSLDIGYTLWLNKGNTLNIYAQSTDPAVMGKLSSTGGYEQAGIGSDRYNSCGDLNVYGGIITTTGGYNGAGIGSGFGSSTSPANGGNVTVYSGAVTATGGNCSAGIGCGHTYIKDKNNIPDFSGGTLTVYGGTVTAISGSGACAIGGGLYGKGADVTVYGGTLTADGYGTAIGGGQMGDGGTVTVYGGTVHATTATHSATAAIGAGYKGKYGGSISIHGGTVVAQGSRTYGPGIGGGIEGFDCTITGGTVTAIGGEYAPGIGGCYESGAISNGNVVITGGNVMAVKGEQATDAIGAPHKSTGSGTLTDGKGNNVYLNTITLDGVEANTRIEAFNGIGSYSLKDVYTLDTNKLFLYLPEGVTPGITTINGQLMCGKMENREGTFGVNCHAPSVNWTITETEHYRICTNGCGAKLEQATHSGDTATCLKSAYCTACGYKYAGVDPHNHETSETYYKFADDLTHTKRMVCCDAVVETLPHENVTDATCLGIAHCGQCDTSYGQTDESNHTGQLEWVCVDKKTHIQKWSCCGLTVGEATPHQLTYTTEGLTISGVCDLCKEEGTVTMQADGGVYNGYAHKAQTTATGILEGWRSFAEPTLTYCCEGGCKTVGEHQVVMTLGDKSVQKSFTVTPKELTVTGVMAFDKSYDGTGDFRVNRVYLDGVVIYSTGQYDGAWDDVADDVELVWEDLTFTIAGVTPGTYETVDVTGVKLCGADAANYTVAESFDDVALNNEFGRAFTIGNATIWITPEDQNLIGSAEVDQTAYVLEGLEEQFSITGVALYDDGYGQVAVETQDVVITLDGADVTAYFDIICYTAVLTRSCEGHTFDENGFCATGSCQLYQEADKVTETDEWGNQQEVYQIWNAGQLYWFAQQVNDYYNNGIYGKLMADITVNEDMTAENLREWIPIGSGYPSYCGNFDGQGHTVSGLYFCDPEATYVGLFGYTNYNYEIKNIGVTNSYFECAGNVGGVIGYGYTVVNNCYVTDTVQIKAEYGVGGLMGYNGGSVSNSHAYFQTLIGGGYGEITNCYYLSETETDDGGKTAEQFASGEVAYLLQSGIQPGGYYDENDQWVETEAPHVWGQTIGTEEYPVLGGKRVYLAADGTYTNTEPGAVARVGGVDYLSVQKAVDAADGQWVTLLGDSKESVVTDGDLYLDLNGYSLHSLTVGGKLYGMDSTTNDYDCSDGYGIIESFDGSYELVCKAQVDNATRRYVAVEEPEGLSFHRIYVGVTHMTLRVSSQGFGYKAAFYGDELVKKYVTGFGFDVWVQEDNKQKLSLDGEEFVAGKTGNVKSLRIEHVLNVNATDETNAQALQTEVYADAFVTLRLDGSDITVEASAVCGTLQQLLEAVNEDTSVYTEEQLTALKNLLETYRAAIDKAACKVDNILEK